MDGLVVLRRAGGLGIERRSRARF